MHFCLGPVFLGTVYVWLKDQLRKHEGRLRSRAYTDLRRAARPRRRETRTPKPTGVPLAPPMGRALGLWVLLRFRLTLAGRALQVRALFSELVLRFGVGFEEFCD